VRIRGWGPRTILFWLERERIDPLPGRTSIERCLVRPGLVTPPARKRKRSDYKRWERSRSMELWQMDVALFLDQPDRSPTSTTCSPTAPAGNRFRRRTARRAPTAGHFVVTAGGPPAGG
jgi:hypothetical protein